MDATYLTSWLHISDIHFGHGSAATKWDQRLVLNKLNQDIANACKKDIPTPKLIFVTGDIANTGHEYDEAADWLIQLANSIGLKQNNIFVVPGNHDIQRDVSKSNHNLQRLLDSLISGREKIDEIIEYDGDRCLLSERIKNYLSFARAFAPFCFEQSAPSDLFWCYRPILGDLKISLLGLNTALLSCDENDKGKLQLGVKQLEDLSLTNKKDSNELKIVLSHHPLDWLADSEYATRWVTNNAHIHLFGHMHNTECESLRSGRGNEYIKIVAGAVHSSSGEPISHGYNITALVHNRQENKFKIRVWPRLWSDPNKEFRVDMHNVPDGFQFAEHDLTFKNAAAKVDTETTIANSIPVVVKEKEFLLSEQVIPNCDAPPITPSWVGRDSELKLLSDSLIKVVAVTGIGGQGKSALAAQYIENISNIEFWDWRDCREQGDTLQTHLIRIIERISNGRISGLAFIDEGIATIIEFFFKTLGANRGIFVFDNIDHYIDVSSNKPIEGMKLLIDNALRKRHNSRFIFTCRPTVAYDNPAFLQISLPGLSKAETEELFSLSGVDISGARAQENISEAQELTQGHPLWLNLIAKQVAKNIVNFDDILADIRQGKDLDLPSVMLKSIWKTLNDKQRKVLRYMAEAVRPETEELLADYISSEINWNQFNKSLRALKALNLVVIKTAPNTKKTLELHPLIRSFIRTEFPIKEREKFINQIARFYDLLISKFRGSIAKGASFSILEYWIHRAELALHANQFKDALKILNEVKQALCSTGHSEEFVRVSSLLFKEIDFTDAILNEYESFDDVFHEFIDVLSHFGEYARAGLFLKKYENAIEGKSARYVNLCNLYCYMYWCKGDYDPAIDWGRRGVELKKKTNLDTRFDCEHTLALAQRDNDDIDSALKYFLQGYTLDNVLGNDNIQDKGGHFYGNIGRCLWLQDKVKEALICYRKAQKLLESEPAPSPTTIINKGWGNLWIGEALEKQADIYSSYCFYKRAFAIWESSFPIKAQIANDRVGKITMGNPAYANLNEYQIETVCCEWLNIEN